MKGAGNPTAAAVVELNVGGALFTTTRSTLAADPDSMLARLVNGNLSSARDAQGRLFIDRDGSNFNIILQYLRNRGRFSLPTCLSQEAVEALQQEADFYQLPELQAILASAGAVVQRGLNPPREYAVLKTFMCLKRGKLIQDEALAAAARAGWQIEKTNFIQEMMTGREFVFVLGREL
eukprot:TRINITY_DN1733_c0_g1_i2.p1 TRINITY_DN1733_c0_g1~~TRINITY_DN1733_c0_g1_i2.p1  ORF type:complete len:178 (+),score=31.36 TRINITY_DN1733_c0_g1_i2:75-608(+)